MELNFGRVVNLPDEEQKWLNEAKYIYDFHRSSNRKKRRYYNGKITLNEVNLGIALPSGLGRLEIGCACKDTILLTTLRCGILERAGWQDPVWICL